LKKIKQNGIFFLDTTTYFPYHFKKTDSIKEAEHDAQLEKRKEVGKMKSSWMKMISWYLVAAMFVIGITPRVYAGFSPSEAISILNLDRASDLEKIRKVLEMKMVRERLKAFGFTPDEIEKKLNQLSDQQIHQLSLSLDELKVGGDGWAVLIVILLIAILVGVIIYVTGHRVVLERGK
jgi:hypothetical protein